MPATRGAERNHDRCLGWSRRRFEPRRAPNHLPYPHPAHPSSELTTTTPTTAPTRPHVRCACPVSDRGCAADRGLIEGHGGRGSSDRVEATRGGGVRVGRRRLHPSRSALLRRRGVGEAVGPPIPSSGPPSAQGKERRQPIGHLARRAGGARLPSSGRERGRDHRSVQPKSARQESTPRLQHQAGAPPSWVRGQKKRLRALEQLRPDVVDKREVFRRRVRRVPPHKLVFLDESGLNAAMTRSHAWVKRGQEYVERTPMNWGQNLTLLGAIRLTGWILLSTMFASTNKDRFVAWLRRKLLPKLHRDDVLVMDNLSAHHDARVVPLCRARGVRVLYLPPYSHDFNPIELGWGFQKQHVRRHAPRTRDALLRVARRARQRVKPRHCRQWFAHAGYHSQPK